MESVCYSPDRDQIHLGRRLCSLNALVIATVIVAVSANIVIIAVIIRNVFLMGFTLLFCIVNRASRRESYGTRQSSTYNDDSFDDDIDDGTCVALYDFVGQLNCMLFCYINYILC